MSQGLAEVGEEFERGVERDGNRLQVVVGFGRSVVVSLGAADEHGYCFTFRVGPRFFIHRGITCLRLVPVKGRVRLV